MRKLLTTVFICSITISAFAPWNFTGKYSFSGKESFPFVGDNGTITVGNTNLIAENFEGSNTDGNLSTNNIAGYDLTGWTTLGYVNPNYATSPMEGTNGFTLYDTNGGYASHTFTEVSNNVTARFRIRVTALPASGHESAIFGLGKDSTLQSILYINDSGQLRLLGPGSSFSSYTTDTLTAGNNYYIKLLMNKLSADDFTASAEFSAAPSFLNHGNKYTYKAWNSPGAVVGVNAAVIMNGFFGDAPSYNNTNVFDEVVVTAITNGGSSLSSFSDAFTRADADSMGANWTEIAGDTDIVSNEANAPQTFDSTDRAAAYTGTACTTVNQYVKVTLTANNGVNCRPGIIFRYTSGAASVYEIRFDDANNAVQWVRLATPGGAETQVNGSNPLTVSFPMTIGVVCTGTGNSTEIRVWTSPTANAPDSGGATWDSASPALTLTDNPAAPVDTGSYVGIGGIGSNGALAYDNFFGGDVP